MTQMNPIRVAIFQANPTLGAVAANAAALRAAARDLSPETQLFVAPELYLLGYPPDDLVGSSGVLAAVRAALDNLATELRTGPAVLIGAPIADARGPEKIVNAAVLIEHGQWRVVAEKMMLPDTGVFDDSRVFMPGTGPGVIEIGGKAIGVMVCEDGWHPEPLELLLSRAPSPLEQIIIINASPFERGKLSERHAVIRARAARARVPFLYVNMVGGQDELVFDGGSFAMDARGEITSQSPSFETGVFVSRQAEKKLDEWEESYRAIMLGTQDYVRKNDFKTVCLGLSGGVDSALVAAIAVDTLGAENVTAMILPSEYSSVETQADARTQAEKFGIKIVEASITPMQKSLETSLKDALGTKLNDIAAQNIQSRLRGVMLMALSNQTGALLLTTGNKSEIAVGYATLYGDMNGGFNPIKDLYKTDVYALCEWRNKNLRNVGQIAAPILPSILSRAPSAELRPGQTDQDTLPPYELLDDILRALVEGNGVPELLAAFDTDLVLRIRNGLDRAEYKRRQAAPGPKVTRKAFGRDRRWPMTHAHSQSGHADDRNRPTHE